MVEVCWSDPVDWSRGARGEVPVAGICSIGCKVRMWVRYFCRGVEVRCCGQRGSLLLCRNASPEEEISCCTQSFAREEFLDVLLRNPSRIRSCGCAVGQELLLRWLLAASTPMGTHHVLGYWEWTSPRNRYDGHCCELLQSVSFYE